MAIKKRTRKKGQGETQRVVVAEPQSVEIEPGTGRPSEPDPDPSPRPSPPPPPEPDEPEIEPGTGRPSEPDRDDDDDDDDEPRPSPAPPVQPPEIEPGTGRPSEPDPDPSPRPSPPPPPEPDEPEIEPGTGRPSEPDPDEPVPPPGDEKDPTRPGTEDEGDDRPKGEEKDPVDREGGDIGKETDRERRQRLHREELARIAFLEAMSEAEEREAERLGISLNELRERRDEAARQAELEERQQAAIEAGTTVGTGTNRLTIEEAVIREAIISGTATEAQIERQQELYAQRLDERVAKLKPNDKALPRKIEAIVEEEARRRALEVSDGQKERYAVQKAIELQQAALPNGGFDAGLAASGFAARQKGYERRVEERIASLDPDTPASELSTQIANIVDEEAARGNLSLTRAERNAFAQARAKELRTAQAQQELGSDIFQAVAGGKTQQDLLNAGFTSAQVREVRDFIASLSDDQRQLLADEGTAALRKELDKTGKPAVSVIVDPNVDLKRNAALGTQVRDAEGNLLVKVGKGEYITQAEFGELSPADKRLITQWGVSGFNRLKTIEATNKINEALYQIESNPNLMQLQGNHFIERDAFEKLPPQAQVALRKDPSSIEKLDAIDTSTQEGINAKYKELKRLGFIPEDAYFAGMDRDGNIKYWKPDPIPSRDESKKLSTDELREVVAGLFPDVPRNEDGSYSPGRLPARFGTNQPIMAFRDERAALEETLDMLRPHRLPGKAGEIQEKILTRGAFLPGMAAVSAAEPTPLGEVATALAFLGVLGLTAAELNRNKDEIVTLAPPDNGFRPGVPLQGEKPLITSFPNSEQLPVQTVGIPLEPSKPLIMSQPANPPNIPTTWNTAVAAAELVEATEKLRNLGPEIVEPGKFLPEKRQQLLPQLKKDFDEALKAQDEAMIRAVREKYEKALGKNSKGIRALEEYEEKLRIWKEAQRVFVKSSGTSPVPEQVKAARVALDKATQAVASGQVSATVNPATVPIPQTATPLPAIQVTPQTGVVPAQGTQTATVDLTQALAESLTATAPQVQTAQQTGVQPATTTQTDTGAEPVAAPTTTPVTAPATPTTPAPGTDAPGTTTPAPATPTTPAAATATTATPVRVRLQVRSRIKPTVDEKTGEVKVRLPRDQYIETIAWKQGFTFRAKNLVTGEGAADDEPIFGVVPDKKGLSPQESLRIVSVSSRVPKAQTIDMGVVDLHIKALRGRVSMQFKPDRATAQRSKAKASGRRFKGSRPKVIQQNGATLVSRRGVKRAKNARRS